MLGAISLLLFSVVLVSSVTIEKEYCVVGAGPSGVQLGYFLQRSNRDYIILERGSQPGTFFTKFPRHDKLISINKRFTGKTNDEFNMRHDWNSLISDDLEMRMTRYSKEFFPDRRVFVKYLADFVERFNISVKYNTDIADVSSPHEPGMPFILTDQQGDDFKCKVLVMATGYSKENTATFEGSEYVTQYGEMSTNPEDYEGKSVIILGRGNSGMEVADSLLGYTNMVHMVGRSRVKLAWETHYVGDIRAVNSGLLDTYQLKSLDGALEADTSMIRIDRNPDTGRLRIYAGDDEHELYDNFALRDEYDAVISCIGFKYDFGVFNKTGGSAPEPHPDYTKFPHIKHNFESAQVGGMFFAGTSTHSLDFKQSAGGFIHGFRYTTRTLFKLLEWKYQGVKWQNTHGDLTSLVSAILKRINEASGTYQMFGVLGDVYIIDDAANQYIALEEFPLRLLSNLYGNSGHNATRMIVMNFEYGKDFSGPGKDIFRPERATGEPSEGHLSNFLHPVFYYYDKPITDEQIMKLRIKESLPQPARLHHMVEDFTTDFNGGTSHILPLRRFIEASIDEDLRSFSSEDCFVIGMTHQTLPMDCNQRYLTGRGITVSDIQHMIIDDISPRALL